MPYRGFSLWFSPQAAYIWGNATNYIVSIMPGYTDLSALFDEVMIDRVEMSVYPTNLENFSNTGSATALMITDYNDKNAPVLADDVLQYNDCRCVPLLSRSPFTEAYTPKMLSYTLDSAGMSQASTPIRGFVRSNLDIEHYCRKGWLISAPTLTQVYTFVFRYTYKCRISK